MDDFEENLDMEDDNESTSAIDDPFAPVIFEENSFLTNLKKDHEKSFESSNNVIDEAIDRALNLIDTASDFNDGTILLENTGEAAPMALGVEEQETISVEDALAIWKGLGKEEVGATTPSPSSDRILMKPSPNKCDDSTTSKPLEIEVDDLAQAMVVELTFGDTATPLVRMSDTSSRLNSSPKECDDIGSDQMHPESLQQLLWDRLANLCEPIQLELKDDEANQKAADTTNSIVSGKFF